jgi:hypothetical protein
MVVKCVFSGVSIHKIVGLEERRNDELLQMLKDLVSERDAAERTVPIAVRESIGHPGVTHQPPSYQSSR